MDERTEINDNLVGTKWIGIVESVDDPEFEGKCKIRVYGKFDDLTVDELPFFMPKTNASFAGGESKGYGQFSTPKVGTYVEVEFNNGDLYAGEYHVIQNINDALRGEISESYENAHSVVYDEDEELKIIYTQSNGLQLFYAGSSIVISPNNTITIEHNETQSIIELIGGEINITSNQNVNVTSNSEINVDTATVNITGTVVNNIGIQPNFSATLHEPLWRFLSALATSTDAKWPPTPGLNAGLAQTAQQLAQSINVKLSK